jgi:hypothetical protein
MKRILDQKWNDPSDIKNYAQILSERILVKNFGSSKPVYEQENR